MTKWLAYIINIVWIKKTIPDDWRRGIILPFWKNKGNKEECSNHRDKTLLSIPGKLFAIILLERITPINQQHHPSYDNAACDGLDISTACHPPSLYEESATSIQTSMVGKDQEAAPKPDGLIQSITTSILLASTPSMLPRWSMTDPQWKAFVCDLPTLEPEHGP